MHFKQNKKNKDFLTNQLVRVNQYRLEHGQDMIGFDSKDFGMSVKELKKKYGEKYTEYTKTLAILRNEEKEEAKNIKLGFWDKIQGLLKWSRSKTYVNRIYKHDAKAMEDFERRMDAYEQTPEFKEYLAYLVDGREVPKEVIKYHIFGWLRSKYESEKEEQEEAAVLLEDKKLEVAPPSNGIEILETSFTAKYARKWGPKRIALDGVQNHLPTDSGGTSVDIKFLLKKKHKWLPLDQIEDVPNDEIKAIKFEDDGKGFDSKLLKYAHSHNKDNKESVGEFGEGLKMLCVAALNHKMKVKLSSRSWVAEPSLISDMVEEDEIQFLQFRVETHDTYTREGSETIFTDLNDEFIEEVKGIKHKVLTLNENYMPLETTESGEIVGRDNSYIYVKGIFTKQQDNPPSMYSYNIFDIELDRDRSKPEEHSLKYAVKAILEKTNSKELLSSLLDWSYKNPASYSLGRGGGGSYSSPKLFEFNLPFLSFENKELLSSCFYDMFGEDALVYSSPDLARKAEKKGYKPLQLNFVMASNLKEAGVKFDWDVVEKEDTDVIESSITLDYEKEKWGVERIVLDGIQNHLPSDSGGTEVKIEFLSKKKNEWLPYSELQNYDNGDIQGVRFSDDGRGFDMNYLRLLVSSKSNHLKSVGQFGEGMKMASAACLRHNIEQTIESRNWRATPFAKNVDLDGKYAKQLRFQTTTFPERAPMKGSKTTYENIGDDFIDEVRAIGDKVLKFDPAYRPLSSTDEGDIVCEGKGRIFVKGFLVTDREKENLIFSYDLKLATSRDREMLEVNNLKENIKKILGKTNDLGIIKHLLEIAELEHDAGYFELQDISSSSSFENQELWVQAFEELYGTGKVVLKSNEKDDWAAVEAKFKGYKVITMNSKIAQLMHRCGILYDVEVSSGEIEYEWIEKSTLSEHELHVLGLSSIVDELLEASGNMSVPIKIYEKATNKRNKQDSLTLGFYDPMNNYIGIKRSQLASLQKFLGTYLEEKAHQISGGMDGSRELFNCVVDKLAVYIIKDISQSKKE